MSDIDSEYDEKSIVSNADLDISDDDSDYNLEPTSKIINKYDNFEEDDDEYDEYNDDEDEIKNMYGDESGINGNDENENNYENDDVDENDGDDDDDDEDDEYYLQKFNSEINKNYILDYHPECIIQNNDEINALTKVVRDTHNNIIDDLHKTLPYLTKYEKTRVLGQRAMQINTPNAKIYVKVPDGVIDGYVIAKMELQEKKIPFIIRRPLPSGGSEFWRLQDLEIIDF
jgi:DNA-directed RNA polymerase I, II, and III subunit RPABC2